MWSWIMKFYKQKKNSQEVCSAIKSKKHKKENLRSVGALSKNKTWFLLKNDAKGETIPIYMYSPRLKIITMNAEHIEQEIEKKNT